MTDNFYLDTLIQLLQRGLMTREMSVLVVCAGPLDRDVMLEAGFKQVTISNLDVRMKGDEFAPFTWSFQDAEDLKYPDGSFDWAVAHSGLHHCYSPVRALLEMYRVARKGVLVLEPRDTFLVRLGVRLNFGQEYEVAAVAGNDLKSGGVRNTQIPNYVYRWTEWEIEKAIAAYDPLARPQLHYFYALRAPEGRLRALKNPVPRMAVQMLLPFLKVLAFLFPKQSNNFAFAAQKTDLPRVLHPWLVMVDGKPGINREWVAERYGEFK